MHPAIMNLGDWLMNTPHLQHRRYSVSEGTVPQYYRSGHAASPVAQILGFDSKSEFSERPIYLYLCG